MTETVKELRIRTRSHSQLSDYYKCSWAFYLKRVLKLRETPSVWLAGGLAFHGATEEFDRAVFGQEDDLAILTGTDYFVGRFDPLFDAELDKLRENDPDETHWRTAGKPTLARPRGEDVTWWRVRGREMVSAYIEWRILTASRLRLAAVEGGPAVEVKVETLLGGVPVVGYIDRIFEDVLVGSLLLADMKSGARIPEDASQLGQYSVQVGQQYGLDITWGGYYDARRGAMGVPIDLTRFTEWGLGEAYRRLVAAIERGEFTPNITALCKSCGMRQYCEYQGGSIPADTTTALEGTS